MIRPKLWVKGHKLYNTHDMNPNDPAVNPQPTSYNNPLNVMSPGEKTLCEIKRHPFGLFGIYLMSAIVIVVVIAAAILAPHYLTGIKSQDKVYLLLAAVIISAIALLFTYIGVTVYNGNRWIVTSDSITQISQVTLFNKQTSQLSLANLEDVTFEQGSFIQMMFGFGTLKVETAGERSKFSFPYCPRPAQYAREIIQAHEDFIRQHPEEQSGAGQGVNINTQAYAQQPQAAPLAPSQPSNDDHSNNPTQG
jgi:uncharacterized membrane protein YdbT with pleckstrin-like domain